MKTEVGSKFRIILSIIIMLPLLGALNSCTKTMDNMPGMGNNTGSKGGSPGTNEVWIQGMAYNPSTITVTAGTTITWTNKDAVSHTVTSNTGLFDSGTIGNNGTYSHTFTTAGTYDYYCTIHPTMTASVKVN